MMLWYWWAYLFAAVWIIAATAIILYLVRHNWRNHND